MLSVLLPLKDKSWLASGFDSCEAFILTSFHKHRITLRNETNLQTYWLNDAAYKKKVART